MTSSWTEPCPFSGGQPVVMTVVGTEISSGVHWGTDANDSQRIYLLDLPDGGNIAIVVEVGFGPAYNDLASPEFQDRIDTVAPVIDTFEFDPSGNDAETTVEATVSTGSVPPELPPIPLPITPSSTVEGLVEVDGHDIYARCAGQGSPTVVYFTGWAPDPSKRGVDIAQGIESALGPEFRVCSYERRNTGRSETVDGTQTPEDVIADVDGFLAALDEDGPFLLLGASFGGLVASAYAVAHPDRVAGMVLLDASTGVDYDIDERHNFPGPCLEANRQADAWDSLEKLDNCSLAKWIHDRRDREPDVPLLYLAAQDASDRGDEADDATRQAWVESWSPGVWRVVSAPHWMDEADTELVADAVREVIAQTG
jgi:alpha/beta hydrolase fold